MTKYTQMAILQAFEEMLEKMPFDKITVSAIVAKCEISSNTFYYHFRDIYDLLDAWLDQQKNRYIDKTADLTSWTDRLKVVLHEMQNHPRLVHHIFDSISRERLERYVFTSVENQFYTYVKNHTAGMEVEDEKLRMMTSFYCYSLLGYLLKFMWSNMETDVDASIDTLGQIFQASLEQMLPREDGPVI